MLNLRTAIMKTEHLTPLESIKWPLIGAGITTLVILVIISITITFKKRSGSGVSVNIENNSSPTFQINNSSHHSEMASPSAPTLNPSSVEEGRQIKNTTPLTIQDGINAIKAIKPENRTPIHDRDLQLYMKELKENESALTVMNKN